MSHDPYAAPNVPQLLGLLEDGEFNSEMADQYRDLIAAMENASADTNGKTKVKATMTLKVDLVLEGGVYEVAGNITTKKPPRKPRRTTMYGTEGNTLSRTNPKQDDFFLRDAKKDQAPARMA